MENTEMTDIGRIATMDCSSVISSMLRDSVVPLFFPFAFWMTMRPVAAMAEPWRRLELDEARYFGLLYSA